MSSAALPNVALRSPPTPSPRRSASCSVARPSHPARGIIAREDAAKTRRWRSGARNSSAIVTGKNSSSQLIADEYLACLRTALKRLCDGGSCDLEVGGDRRFDCREEEI